MSGSFTKDFMFSVQVWPNPTPKSGLNPGCYSYRRSHQSPPLKRFNERSQYQASMVCWEKTMKNRTSTARLNVRPDRHQAVNPCLFTRVKIFHSQRISVFISSQQLLFMSLIWSMQTGNHPPRNISPETSGWEIFDRDNHCLSLSICDLTPDLDLMTQHVSASQSSPAFQQQPVSSVFMHLINWMSIVAAAPRLRI